LKHGFEALPSLAVLYHVIVAKRMQQLDIEQAPPLNKIKPFQALFIVLSGEGPGYS